ncbi:MAG TPA: GNAT family N-acetyltransferase [Ginsengibacter sp.]|nr:GNAT family N-acetyltransferase [Ginsengibacter sp.]
MVKLILNLNPEPVYKLDALQENSYPVLLEIWESSVRATHHFLRDGDIDIFKKTIRENEIFSHVALTCVRDTHDNIVGFMGTSGDSLEMLFISPSVMKQGVGKMLLLHAINNLGVTKVEVNEQNINATKFYEHFGFNVISKSDLDGMGMPYPLLHMERK